MNCIHHLEEQISLKGLNSYMLQSLNSTAHCSMDLVRHVSTESTMSTQKPVCLSFTETKAATPELSSSALQTYQLLQKLS